jgi:hypothetical protein
LKSRQGKADHRHGHDCRGDSKQPHNIEAILLISGVAGLIVAAAGCMDFCRREVQ